MIDSLRRPLPGNSLFQVVVDNDDTVTKILNQMRRDNIRGRVTFMPLNRLKTPTVQIPPADDVVPMISKLRFDRTYRLALEQVRTVCLISLLKRRSLT